MLRNCPKELKLFDHILVEYAHKDVRGKACIYFLSFNDILVYVGKSTHSLTDRKSGHKCKDNKIFNSLHYFELPMKGLKYVEQALIHLFKPKYNVQHIKYDYTTGDDEILSQYRNEKMETETNTNEVRIEFKGINIFSTVDQVAEVVANLAGIQAVGEVMVNVEVNQTKQTKQIWEDWDINFGNPTRRDTVTTNRRNRYLREAEKLMKKGDYFNSLSSFAGYCTNHCNPGDGTVIGLARLVFENTQKYPNIIETYGELMLTILKRNNLAEKAA